MQKSVFIIEKIKKYRKCPARQNSQLVQKECRPLRVSAKCVKLLAERVRMRSTGPRQVFKDYFSRHSDLCRSENRFPCQRRPYRNRGFHAGIGEIFFKNPLPAPEA